MCAILSIFGLADALSDTCREYILKLSKLLRHRGPDWSGIYTSQNAILAHERLAIVDIKSGSQPILSLDKNLILTVNGEIYNHLSIRNDKSIKYDYQTNSDCEVILSLYKNKSIDFLNDINGIFSFIIYDKNNNSILVARDPIGVIPLYMGSDKNGNLLFASEMKCLVGICNDIKEFPPGTYMNEKLKYPVKYYTKSWMNYNNVSENKTIVKNIKKSLEDSVKRQLMSDVPFGVLLSGGLDSSIIASIVKKFSNYILI